MERCTSARSLSSTCARRKSLSWRRRSPGAVQSAALVCRRRHCSAGTLAELVLDIVAYAVARQNGVIWWCGDHAPIIAVKVEVAVPERVRPDLLRIVEEQNELRVGIRGEGESQSCALARLHARQGFSDEGGVGWAEPTPFKPTIAFGREAWPHQWRRCRRGRCIALGERCLRRASLPM